MGSFRSRTGSDPNGLRGTSETDTTEYIDSRYVDDVAAYSGQVGGFESSPSKNALSASKTQDTRFLTFVISVLINAAW